MVLVLGEAHRHRELEERIAVLQALAGDDAPVPQYAKEFGVVFGGAGLRAFLESRAQQALAAVGAQKDVDRKKAEISAREVELREVHGDLIKQKEEVAKRIAKLDADRAKLEAD